MVEKIHGSNAYVIYVLYSKKVACKISLAVLM